VGRIEEALRRASGETSLGTRMSAQQGQFVSPWGVEDSPTPTLAGARTPTRPTPAKGQRSERDVLDNHLLVAPAHAALPVLSAALGERLTSDPRCNPLLVEQFRRLAGVLHKSQVVDGTKVVMVTSAAPSDGKTMTAINLALALSGSYKRRVLLIDADLRRPSIGESLGLEQSAGLSEALKAGSEQKLAVIPITATLTLLPAGRPDPDPVGGLTSVRMRRILEEAAARFDWVVLDAPPVGLLADANLMIEEVDRTLLVVRAGQTQYPMVDKAVELLGKDRLLGVVLNGVDRAASEPYLSAYTYGERP
jgi:protein-tyrosine kinase